MIWRESACSVSPRQCSTVIVRDPSEALHGYYKPNYLTISEYLAGIGFRHFSDPSAVVIFICEKHHKTSPNRRYYSIHI